MAIYLHEKFQGKIAEAFTKGSYVDGRLNNQYSFTGVRTVKISTPLTVPLSNYKRSGANRYGSPTEMQDTVQEMTLTEDKSFTLTIDKGNNLDQQGIKAAGKMLALQVMEQVVPEKDRHTFLRLAKNAGIIVGNSTVLNKTNICERISEGTRMLDEAEVPSDNRTLFVTPLVYKTLRLSDEFIKVEALAQKSLAKGQVGEYDGMTVVKVISSRFPANLNFLIVHKSSATAPSKIADTKLHQDPPGLSGNLLEGRFYYGCFVIGVRAKGIYAEVDTGTGKGTVLEAPVVTAAGAITVVSGTNVRYTIDGSDPRYSANSVLITASATAIGAVGETIRAYAFKADDGTYPSPLTESKRA